MKGSNQPLKQRRCCSSHCCRTHSRQGYPQKTQLPQATTWSANCDCLNLLPIGVFQLNANGEIVAVSDRWSEMTGLAWAEVQGKQWTASIHPSDRAAVEAAWQRTLAIHSLQAEYRWHSPTQPTLWALGQLVAQKSPEGEILSYVGTISDITAQKQATLASQPEPAANASDRIEIEAALREREAQLQLDIIERQQAEELLRQQSERERLIAKIAQQIRQSLNLDTILSTTVENIRHSLESDRVLIYRVEGNHQGCFVAESVGTEWPSLLRVQMQETWSPDSRNHYHQGLVATVSDLQQANFPPEMTRFLRGYGVQAAMAAPILQGGTLWGLLVVHQCQGARDWQTHEIDLLQQLAAQVAIAIHQSELFQQVQQLNTVLEDQVQERTAQLAQALDFEARLKRITDKVRDSLDEDHILTTAVQELALGLSVRCCDTGIYNADHTISTITHEYSDDSAAIGRTIEMTTRPEIYQQLLQGQYLQFCICNGLTIRSIQSSSTILACPIVDDQGVLGDLWLFRPNTDRFNELEIRLVQQVANQCAIAIRQARLYQAAQAQVAELEKLNRLKDDFLSTVSHELRTPMSSIKMATQMLEMSLMRAGQPVSGLSDRTSRYFQVLHDECDREIKLINDLLDLTRLDAETEPLLFTAINPHCWIPSVVEPFLEQARQQEQPLQVQLPPNLPTLHTDLNILKRIFSELLRNACKYTPRQAAIAITAEANSESFWLSVQNFGVEIADIELAHVFDKFYRIPNHDPWKHGGTGLGLALVKKLVEHLGGTIQATSQESQVCFTVQLPIAPNPST
ncbi:MAG TPA: GAF domain-containing protein [Allocoleopsis sp.]